MEKSRDCTCAVLFFCYLSTTLTQLLFHFTKRAVAHCAAFLAPFLLLLAILCFQDTTIADFFPCKKNIWRSMEKKHKNPPRNLAQRCRLCMVKILIRQDPTLSFNNKKLCMYAFYGILEVWLPDHSTRWCMA